MRRFEIPVLAMSLCGLGLLSGLDTAPAYAGFTFGEPVRLRTIIPALNEPADGIDCLSFDGLELYIDSKRPGGYGDVNLWVLKRASINEDWGPPENLGALVNDQGAAFGSISADGLTLYFTSDRPGGYGDLDLWATTRATKNDPWRTPTNLGPTVNSPNTDACPWISADGLELYFQSWRTGGYSGGDIYVARRATQSDPWAEPVNLGPLVNTKYDDLAPSLSPDGLLLWLSSNRPGGQSNMEIWIARRQAKSQPWSLPVNLGPRSIGPGTVCGPRVSPDGQTLYFMTMTATAWDNEQAPILPVVDFNGDGKVDLVDLVMLIDDWGKSESACDIGPMPWGDGKVDMEDLKVFMSYYEKENPPAKP